LLMHKPILELLLSSDQDLSVYMRKQTQQLIHEQAHQVVSSLGGDILARMLTTYARVNPTDIVVSASFHIGVTIHTYRARFTIDHLKQMSAADVALHVRSGLGTRFQRNLAQSGRFEDQAT